MIHPVLIKQDWFYIDEPQLKAIRHLPGGNVLLKKRPIIHRSMLPLLDSDEAEQARMTQPNQTWAAREKWAADRGFKFRVTQQQALDYIEPRRGVLVGDDMRLGKGHPVGTNIMTPEGWCPIEELKPGSQVVGSNGKPCTVTGVFPRGCLPTYRVTFSDGASVVVDGEHLWSAWTHNDWNRGRPARTVRTMDLIDDLTYGNHGNRKWQIQMVQPIEFPHRKLPLDPYVLGVLLGDGSFTSGGLSFTPGDELVPQAVHERLPIGVHLVEASSEQRATCWRISRDDTAQPNPVIETLRSLGLWDLTSERKFVPVLYTFTSVDQRLALLRGLMDTDGELRSDGYVGFSSSSQALMLAVQYLVESVGGCAREMKTKTEPKYSYRGETRIGLPSYRLSIMMPRGVSPFLTRVGYQPHTKYFPTRKFVSIEPTGTQHEVICISVDAADQLYVTERCIVTHNTLTALASHDPARGQLVIVAPLQTRAVWIGWAKRLFPELEIGICAGKKFDPAVFDKPIVFAHYDIISKWQSLRPIGTLVFDEAHFLTNRKTDRTNAAVLLQSRAEKVLALTGTPIWNMPPNLWAVAGLVAPAAFGSYHDFGNRYGRPEQTGYGTIYTGSSNEAELNARMTEIMIRRLWKDCAQDLPPISRGVLVSEVSDAERKKLDILAGALKAERGKSNTQSNLAAYIRQVSALKVKFAVPEIVKVLNRGEPIVVWTWHKDAADQLKDQLGDRAEVIHGDIAVPERELRMTAWKTSTTPKALIATMSVAQVGIDLSHAHIAMFVEIYYIPAIIGQAEMRTFDASRAMDVTFVVANHLIDQRMVRALVSKLGAQDSLGVGAACDAIDSLRDAMFGAQETGDLDRLLQDLLESAA